MAHLLGAESIHLEYPNRIVFESVTIGVQEGDRIGIVGRNGDGKSTLLRILAGTLEPNSGQVTRRGGVRMGMLDQTDTLDAAMTVGDAVVGDTPEYVWAGDPKIRDIIAGLVADLPWDKVVGELSGGQRRRVALAHLLVGDWDILALDEPTNHLDVEGITWLAGHLKNRWPKNQGCLLVVTHDRWFLDEVSLDTWEVHDRIVEPFEGGYAAYVLQRVERDRQAAVVEAKRQNLMRKELAWLRRGAPARTSKPKFRIDAANELIADVPEPRNRLELSRLATARLGKDVVDLLDAGVTFGSEEAGTAHEVLREVTWRIAPGERSAVMGANGAGKSTLLGLIAGAIAPTAGRVKHGKTVRIGVLDQQFSQLDDIGDELVREVLAGYNTSYTIDGKDLSPAQLLERLGFAREHLSSKVSELSGGQRRRFQLLMVLLAEPNVLILDEPSNDVDTDMLAAMEDLLDSWPGTLIVVSHDRYLVERATDQQYAIIDGHLRHLPGGVDEYLRLRTAQAAAPAGQPAGGGQPGPVNTPSGGADEHGGHGGHALTGAEERAIRKELGAVERKMDKVAARIEKIHAKMAAADQSDFEGVMKLDAELREAQAENDELEERWLELSELCD